MPPAEEQKPSSHQTWRVENPPFMDDLVPLKHLFSASVSLVGLPCLMTRPSPRGWRGMSGVYTGLYPKFLVRENDDYDQLIRGSRFHSSQSMWTKGGIYLEDSKSIRRIPSIRAYRAI